jgi:uncharacterized protein YbaR (Trm112 family)
MTEEQLERLLPILVCPATRTKLRWDRGRDELVSDEAGLAYPIQEGTPVLLIEAARRLDGEPAQQ